MTVKDFIKISTGVDEFEIRGKSDPEYKSIGEEYGFFFRSDLEKNPPDYEKFKDRQIESMLFYSSYDSWVVCEIKII